MQDANVSDGLKRESFSGTSEEFSQHDKSASDNVHLKGDLSRGRGAYPGADTRGRRRAPRRFGGWRGGSRRATGTYSRMARGERATRETNAEKPRSAALHPKTNDEDEAAAGGMENETLTQTHDTSSVTETLREECDEEGSPSESVPVSELVCEPDDTGVRTVEEKDNSLVIHISCASSGDTEVPEPQTRPGYRGQGFRGRGFRGQRRGRGRVGMVDNRVVDHALGIDSSSDANTVASNKSQFEEEEHIRGGGIRGQGKRYGTGWRRGGGGRYFRQRPGGTRSPDRMSEPRSHKTNLGNPNGEISAAKTSDTSVADEASKPLLAYSSGEQYTSSTGAENVALVNDYHGRQSTGRRPRYIVRRSYTGRRNLASSASRNEARVTLPQQQAVKTEDSSSTVPCSVTEDWDAECVPVEPAITETRSNKTETETDTTEIRATLNSSGIDEELNERPTIENSSS